MDSNTAFSLLCSPCTNIFGGREKPRFHCQDRLSHHTSLASFETALADGCVLCRRLRAALREDKIELECIVSSKANPWRGMICFTGGWLVALHSRRSGSYKLRISAHYQRTPGKGELQVFQFFQRLIPRDGPERLFLASLSPGAGPVSTSTDSPKSWATALEWYEDCRRNHRLCNKERAAGNSYHPRRLIDVSGDWNQLKLIANTDNIQGEYATLSHCWGTSQPLGLRQANERALCSHITADDLPKTFREAIATAKKFGISYLWIDSFCIIQDSHSDWLAEAATMEAVYSNSALNIMATASRGVEDGLFRTHGGVTVTPCVVRAAWDDMQPETFVLGSHKTWIDLALKTPLHARGWVLQERILPPRALHFGHDQLIWECRGQDACEAFPQGIPTVLCQTTYHRVKVTEVVDFRAWLAVKDPDRLLSDQDLGFELWDRIISWYASTQLTNQSDMLVAISGLAKRFQRILNDRYLAGLWAKKLEKHLLWRPGPDSAGRPVIPSAPTWSWASMKCGFSFDPHSMYGHDGIKCIEVENVNVNTVDPNDDTGPVLDGYIRLRGHPIFAEFYRIPRFDEFPQLCFDKGRTRGNCHLDDRNDVKAILSCVFLPVNQGIIAGVGQKVSGLILQSKPTRQGWYCRKGVATVWRDPSGDYETGWKNLVQRLEGVTKTDGTLCLESSPGTIMLM